MMDTQTLLARVDLRALAEEAGAVFAGKGMSSHCPLHGGKNPGAFHLYAGNGVQRWHCFTNCPEDAKDGDAITFYMRWKGVGFAEAVKALAEREGLKVETGSRKLEAGSCDVDRPGAVWEAKAEAFVTYAEEQLWGKCGEQARGYLWEARGLCEVTLRQARVGFNPQDWRDKTPARWGLDPSTAAPKSGASAQDDSNRPVWIARGIVIPTLVEGRVTFVNIRRPLPNGDALGKAIGPASGLPEVKYAGIRGGVRRLWGGDTLRGLETLLLAEGEFDALLAWQECGDLADVATIGGARMRLRMDDACRILRARRILAAYDADEAGDAGADSLAALSERVVRVRPPAHDLTELYRQGGSLGLRNWLRGALATESAMSSHNTDTGKPSQPCGLLTAEACGLRPANG